MNTPIKAGVSRRVAAIRAELQCSQISLAKALSSNASSNNIGRIERGEVKPTMTTLAKIAFAADVDLTWLATGKADMTEGKPLRVPGIGKRLQKLRVRAGMSQRAAAGLLSPSPSAKNIGRIEQNEVRPMPATLHRLAGALGTRLSYLVNGQ
jgi:transcriptional regulator with XRE-family HTH domain